MTLPRAASALAAAAVVLAACGGESASDGDGDTAVSAVTSVYALEWLVQELGGDRVEVSNVIDPGADAHSLELSPQEVAAIEGADVVTYLSDFQPAMDDAVSATGHDRVLDVAEAANLLGSGAEHNHDHDHDDDQDDDGHIDSVPDPHFWLDAQRMIDVADAIVAELSEVDPDGTETYETNLETVTEDLTGLDHELTSGLESCEITTAVVNHEAFMYLLSPNGIDQVGISGIDPEVEPSPARVAEISGVVDDLGTTTIYGDVTVSSAVAETLATDAGVDFAYLDPLESAPTDGDYLSAMRDNLDTLRIGQSCS